MNTIQLFKVFMASTVAENVVKALNSGYIGQGPKVEEFENILRKHFKHEYVLTLNSGTSALHLALHLLGKSAKHERSYVDAIMVSEKELLCEGHNNRASWRHCVYYTQILIFKSPPMPCICSSSRA